MPLLVRWMLVYEEPDSNTLWLCKAVPKRWFAPGQTIRVRNAPTRWGPVSFEVKASESSVTAHIIPPPGLRGEILLRVRRPGRPSGAPFDAEREAFVIRSGEPVTVTLAAE
jgi:hypothetical protein